MAESFVENDALPEEPIPLSVQNEPQSVVQPTHTQESDALELAIQRDFQSPTGAWEFNRMLLKLSEELTDDNLEKLKFRFSGGEGGLGKGVQEKIKKPIELFRILQERHWLTRDNLLKLQAALRDIGRMDLVRVTAEYAQKMNNVLYFYQPSETVNGYRSVKLHLCNCNYEKTHRNHIQMIRTTFSELVGCALEDIVIVGLEPATSLILTFHVPEFFVCMFKELMNMSTCKSGLKDIGIDMVEIEGEDELFNCSDEDVNSKSMTEEQKKLYNVYQLLEKKTKLLDSAEIKLLELENEKFQCEALLKSLKSEFVKSADNVLSEKDELLKKFQALLQRPELASYDKALILSLLDTNSKIISRVAAESQELRMQQMELKGQQKISQILDLRNKIVSGPFERLKHRTFTDNSIISGNRYLPTSLIPRKRADSQKVKGMYQHLELVPKWIADKTESESKREHTLSYKRKEDADLQVTKTMPQIQETHEEKHKSMKSHDTLFPRTDSGFNEGFCSQTTSDCAKRTDLPKVKGMYQHLRSEPKWIAEKTEGVSKREHTVSYKRKEDTDPATKIMQQIQEMSCNAFDKGKEDADPQVTKTMPGIKFNFSPESGYEEDDDFYDLIQQLEDNQ